MCFILSWVLCISPTSAVVDVDVYARDLDAFFAEMDREYPFFDAKEIRSDWTAAKKKLGKAVRRCSSDREFVEILVEAMKCLRDGHMSISDLRPKLDPPPSEYYPGLHLLPGKKGSVVVMATASNLESTLPAGTIIAKIAGKPAGKYLEKRAALS